MCFRLRKNTTCQQCRRTAVFSVPGMIVDKLSLTTTFFSLLLYRGVTATILAICFPSIFHQVHYYYYARHPTMRSVVPKITK